MKTLTEQIEYVEEQENIKYDLREVLGEYLSLRLHPHAQKEIQLYAQAILQTFTLESKNDQS